MADETEPPTKPELPGGAVAKPRSEPRNESRFEHVREIGRGGMGRVVEARDRQLGRIVALKESLDEFPEARLRFEREVAITARLEHPSIVPLYDAGVTADGAPFYVMRKVTGSPLDQLLRRATTLDKRLLLLPHMLAVADAIAHAHQRGVIHRDLKPHNVLVGEHGETIVIDWGLAKTIDEADVAGAPVRPSGELQTVAGSVIGTPGFMAPEQVSAGKIDERSDVYSLGACLYYLLSGRTPFAGSTEDEVLARTQRGELDPLDKLAPGLPPDLRTIVSKAMATDPKDRYLDAGGLSVDLRRFLGGQLVASHHYPPLQRIARWVRRHRAVVAATLVGLAIAVTIAVVLLGRVLDERERTTAALAAERARGDDLVIAQATSYLDSDPTRTIATLQTLRADSPRWANLGPLLADARARGVAVGYPGNGALEIVEFASDRTNTSILTSGSGYVRLHDAAARTTQTLVDRRGTKTLADWCGPLLVLVDSQVGPPVIYDPRTKAKASIEWTAKVGVTHIADGVIVFIDDQHRVVSLDVTGLPLTAKPVVIEGTAPEPHWLHSGNLGRTLLVSSNDRSQVFRRDGTWKKTFEMSFLPSAYALDEHEQRVLAAHGDEGAVIVTELDAATGAVTGTWNVGKAITRLLYAGGRPYGTRLDEMVALEPGGEVRSLGDVVGALGVTAVGDWLAMLETPRRIVIRGPGFARTIHSPIDLGGLTGDPHGRYLTGHGRETLLVWDLAYAVPARAVVDHAEHIAFIDAQTLVGDAMEPNLPSRHVERYRITAPFTIEKSERIANVPPLADIEVLANGTVKAVERALEKPLEVVLDPVVGKRRDLSFVVAAGAGAVYAATQTGVIERVELATGAATEVARVDGETYGMAANADWLVAQTKAGAVIRRDKSGRIEHATVTGAGLDVAIAGDGTAYFIDDEALVAWPVGGQPAAVQKFSQGITALWPITRNRVLVQTRDGRLHLHDPATRTSRVLFNATPNVSMRAAVSRSGELAAGLPTNGVSVIRTDGGDPWSIADDVDLTALAIAPDGNSLVVSLVPATAPLGPWTLLRFDTTLPSPSLAWVQAATNARPPATPRSAIEWAPVASP